MLRVITTRVFFDTRILREMRPVSWFLSSNCLRLTSLKMSLMAFIDEHATERKRKAGARARKISAHITAGALRVTGATTLMGVSPAIFAHVPVAWLKSW